MFDHDKHPNINAVISGAGDVDIDIAFSNPCFEIWLILHFQDHDAYDNRHEVQRKLAEICPKYELDNKTIDFELLLPNVADAEARAERMAARRVAEAKPFGNPFTGVYRLTRRIMQG